MANNSKQVLEKTILPVLAPGLRALIKKVPAREIEDLVEIRVRVNKPLLLEKVKQEVLVSADGEIVKNVAGAYRITKKDIKETLHLMTNSSLYTLEEELKSGFLTLTGGHRVGFVGQVISDNKSIRRIKNISALNIRLCQEIIGAADKVIDNVIAGTDDIHNTLIISPPRCGKTTLIRDLIRQISNGISDLNFSGLKVGVVDERSEIGGAYQGLAQNSLGIRTDLLDRAPKAEGMLLLIRSMSPDVIVTDEIGSLQDVEAIQESLNAGVRVVTTVHDSNLREVKARPSLQGLFEMDTFKRIIILSQRFGPGTVEQIIRQ
ncbi:stage III sporulation protein AA [Halanaerobacter jeridensis]|uniref:Stage III sporulation protein AA n=1 Tax=Halanaerobacter jeridensis TaxID=706427 RepID=A0A938XS24_9FIRM|nr:stage III sporulation protein AA [Halanaerobacter jeridensis]MBM7555221.1 stage III sporulation protein AA [Halanaerobacter jeridensis]